MSDYSIDKLAQLAHIDLSSDEKENLSADLNQILSFVDEISQVVVDDVEPTASINYLKNVTRDDIVDSSLPRERVLQESPLSNAGFIKVPKVLE